MFYDYVVVKCATCLQLGWGRGEWWESGRDLLTLQINMYSLHYRKYVHYYAEFINTFSNDFQLTPRPSYITMRSTNRLIFWNGGRTLHCNIHTDLV